MNVYFEEGIDPKSIDIAVMYDDIADSCGTMINCARALKNLGIPKVIGVATHPVFSGNAIAKLAEEDLEIIVSNTIPLPNTPIHVHVVDISKILGVTLHSVTTGHGSLSKDIFEPRKYRELERLLSTAE